MSPYKVAHLDVVSGEKFDQKSNFSNKPLRILLGVAVDIDVIVDARSIEFSWPLIIGIPSKFLLSKVATDRPNPVVIACTLPFHRLIFFYLYLPPTNHAFDSIHRNQIVFPRL